MFFKWYFTFKIFYYNRNPFLLKHIFFVKQFIQWALLSSSLIASPANSNIWDINEYINGAYDQVISPYRESIKDRFMSIVSNYCIDILGLQNHEEWFHYYLSPEFSYNIMWNRVSYCNSVEERLWVIPMEISDCGIRNDTWEIVCTIRNEQWQSPLCIPEPNSQASRFRFWDCRDFFRPN